MPAILRQPLRSLWPSLCLVAFAVLPARAQAPASQTPAESQAELGAKIDALTHSIEQMQSQLQQSQAEIQQLREMLAEVLRAQGTPSTANAATAATAATAAGPAGANPQAPAPSAPPAQISEDDWQVMNARLQEHEQVKVASASRYRLTISGIALFNVFDTSGQVDNLDAPSVAMPTSANGSGSLSASFRQSLLGLRGIGPRVFGASTSADLQVDFLNGTAGPYGYGAGIMGLRIARVQFDWKNTSITGGLETPFFSPNSPTSYLSLAVPAFASAGNLWNWTPDIRAERRFDFDSAELKVEGGFLDSEGYVAPGSSQDREPTPGEASRQPVYAVRLSGNNRSEDRAIAFGFSGIYAPLSFPGKTISASGALADWKFPLLAKLQVSGGFFSGKGLDGFGGLALPTVPSSDYVHYLYVTAPTLAGIPEIGGWSQLKFTLNSRSEFNLAGGLGQRNAGQLRAAAQSDSLLLIVPPSNRVFFFNYIFRPRSDLVFSAEYRRFNTGAVVGVPSLAGQVGLAAGFLF